MESGTGRKGFENYVPGIGSIGSGGLDSWGVKMANIGKTPERESPLKMANIRQNFFLIL